MYITNKKQVKHQWFLWLHLTFKSTLAKQQPSGTLPEPGSFFPSIRGPSGLQTTLPDVTQNAAFVFFLFFLSQRTTLMQRQSVIKTRPLISPQTKSAGIRAPGLFGPRRSLDPYVVVSVFRSALRVQHTGTQCWSASVHFCKSPSQKFSSACFVSLKEETSFTAEIEPATFAPPRWRM